MVTELELNLHTGKITLFEYLEKKRMELTFNDDRPQAERWRRISELDIVKGLTPRMRAYCQKHGLSAIPDLDIIWKKPRICSVWPAGGEGI